MRYAHLSRWRRFRLAMRKRAYPEFYDPARYA
jgi:hypothetical protein